MSAAELSVSAAVMIAWKIAAGAARSTGQNIEPAHFLFGIFSLTNVPPGELPPERRAEAQAEIADLQRRLHTISINPQEIRRKLRSELLSSSLDPKDASISQVGGAVSRSLATRSAFECAQSGSIAGGSKCLTLVRLTHCLLLQELNGHTLLNLDEPTFRALVDNLSADGPRSNGPQDLFLGDSLEGLSIFQSVDAEALAEEKVNSGAIAEHFISLCELCWAAGTSSSIEALLDASVEILLKAIPAAQHAAILMLDSEDNFLLKAHFPKGALTVSTSSARKAIHERASFIWQRGEDLSASQLESDLRAGIYAPILVVGEVFGVICLDANAAAAHFDKEHLLLVTALGHQLGLTVANRKLEADLLQNAKVMERLLTNFSPKVRDRLLLKAKAGRLKLGGERSVISILCSDIRGFTRLTADMDAEEVVAMLNDYFSAMVAVVFQHGGSIDKFIGDSIMAVFGSPEADALHAEKSLRAAVEMQAEINKVSTQRKAVGLPVCEIGIGVHTGTVIHGFIGSPARMEFTVIGNAVNLAARYCDAAQGGEVILSPELLERVWKHAVVEAIEISTKHEGLLRAYRLLEMHRPK